MRTTGALALFLAIATLTSCGTANPDANSTFDPDHAAAAFRVVVLPATFELGGSTGGVTATVADALSTSDYVTVNINVADAQELKSLYIALSYDPSQYRATGLQPTALMGAPDDLLTLYVPTARGSLDYGQVLVHADEAAGFTGSGVMAQVTFSREPQLAGHAVSNAGPPMTAASQTTDLAFDGANLTWSYFQQGDYDQNGETNVADLTPISINYQASSPNGAGNRFPVTSAQSVIDGDNNGIINISDITLIGQNIKRDTLGGYHVFASNSASDYPSGNPPTGPNGPGAVDLTLAPGSPVLVTEAVNYAARHTERLRFLFAVPAPTANDLYWVRPADENGTLGIASNLIPGGAGAPMVTSTVPANGSQGAARNISLTATFSRPMDPATISTTTFTLTENGNPVAGTVSYSGVTATFNPTGNLAADTLYTGTITTGATDLGGAPLAGNHVWTFTTGSAPDNTAPMVSSTEPANGAASVAINSRVTATFTEAMNPQTMDASTFTLTQGGNPVAGQVSYSGVTATFVPAGNLLSNTTYTATITTGAEDLAGNALGANYVWTFQTSAAIDSTRPTVTSTVPANGNTNVAINTRPTATFSEAMDPLTISTATFTLRTGATIVSGQVTYAGVTATFDPAGTLLSDTLYEARITTGARDLAGNSLAADYVWTFRTSTAVDNTAPTVVSTAPANGATDVAVNANPSATFSEPMDALTITAATFTLMDGATAEAGQVTYSGVTATFTPTGNLKANTLYTARITTTAEDLAGNPLASDYVWTFTTGTGPDNVNPTVTSTVPLNGASGVAANVRPTATFSEAMNPLTLTTVTFTLRQGATPVMGTVTYVAGTATFTPASELLDDTLYTASITTGARDLAGNPLANDFVWTFTTAFVNLGAMAPFGSFGGGSGMTNQGTLTVINGDIGTTGVSTMMTGFHDEDGDVYTETPLNAGQVNGQIYTAPPMPGTAEQLAIATQASVDAQQAYSDLSPANLPGGSDPGAGQLGGLTLAPGVYQSAGGTFQITGSDLVLDGQGNPNAVWVFQAASSLTVGGPGAPRSVILINGAQAQNVYWWVGSAATINAAGGGTMAGTIIASAGVTFSTAGNMAVTTLNGRAIGLNASVTLVNTVINMP